MDDLVEAAGKAICAEKCAVMGEPPCWSIEGQWPPEGCDSPGCNHEARAAIEAILPAIRGKVIEEACAAVEEQKRGYSARARVEEEKKGGDLLLAVLMTERGVGSGQAILAIRSLTEKDAT
jgi:hypothetical protein